MTAESLLIIDDDIAFSNVLAKAITRRGYKTQIAHSGEETLRAIKNCDFNKVVLDLNLGNDSGLALLPNIVNQCSETNVVILTGYSSIATAVEAIKLGATNYLCKPADANEILAAFNSTEGNPNLALSKQTPSIDRVQWEHIQKVLNAHEGNISATARSLGMHRRTLQRKLKKRPVPR